MNGWTDMLFILYNRGMPFFKQSVLNTHPLRWFNQTAVFASCLFLLGVNPVYAQVENNSAQGLTGLSLLEQTVFAQTFETETFEKRVERLEKTVFGGVQTGGINDRQEHLNTVILSAQPPTPDKTLIPKATAQQSKPDATEYPVVVALEREIMGRDFIYSPLDLRLNRLEQKVFGRKFSEKALSDRVDQLLEKYPEVRQTLVQSPSDSDSNSVLSNLPDSSREFVGGSDTYKKLTILEKNMYGETYDDDLITERLDRLEKKAYGYALSGQSVSTRLDRLVNGYSTGYASKPRSSSKYSPRYSSTRLAYTQTETTQATNSTAPQSTPSKPHTSKEHVSVGTSAISENTYRYSPEMVQMLPQNLQRQYYQRNGYSSLPSSGSTVVQNRSTVILPNGSSSQTTYSTAGGTVSRSTQYSGFQTYSDPTGMNQTQGNSLSYQNYSVNPNGSVTQSRTEVYTTPGSTLTVTKEKYIPSQMPGYTGNPSVLHHLTQLEANMYARDFSAEPVPERLSRLERALTGRVYKDFTDAERLNNLLKVYQYQSLARYLGQPAPANQQPVNGVKLKIPLN